MWGQDHSHSLPLQGQRVQALIPLSHSFWLICIFPDLHWKVEAELGSFSATDELITPVKNFCLSHIQMKSKISLSFGIIKSGIGKMEWVHNKAFQIWAAFNSYGTLILNARALLHESSLHPKHSSQAEDRTFPVVPLILLHISLLFGIFPPSPHDFFCFILVPSPPFFISCTMLSCSCPT